MMAVPWTSSDVCTLPSNEQPLRIAEFDDLFATSLQGVERRSPTTLRLVLSGADGLIDRVQDLTDRETACCSFFTFTLVARSDPALDVHQLHLDIEVPQERADVLEAVTQRAEAAVESSLGKSCSL